VAKLKITQAAAERITPPKTGRLEFFDTLLPGFGLRVSSSGHKAWFLFYRSNGVQRRYIIATFGMMPKVEAARDAAREILREVARGNDPATAKAARKSAPPVDAPPLPVVQTVNWLANEFIERYARPKNKSWAGTQRTLALHVLPVWGNRAVRDLTKQDVHALLDAVVDGANHTPSVPAPADKDKAKPVKSRRAVGGPSAANHVLAAVRKLLNWATMRGIIDSSPAAGVQPPSPKVERDHTLADDELAKLYHTARREGGIAGAFVRALTLTAQRRTEVASMRWVDLDLESRVWELPPETTKNARAHVVPLSNQMVALLTGLPRTGPFVFSSTRGERPLSGYSKVKSRMDRLSGVGAWRYHDLRRTAATGMTRHLKVPRSTVGLVLNHSETGVTKIYDRYDYLDEKRAALDAWGERVEKLAKPKAEEEVQAEDTWDVWLERLNVVGANEVTT
jgi:integrase